MKKFCIIMPIVMTLGAPRMPDKKPEPISAEQLIEHIRQLQKTPGYHLLHPDHKRELARMRKKLTHATNVRHTAKLSHGELDALHKKITHHQEAVKKLKESHRNPTVGQFLKQLESIERSEGAHEATKALKKDLADTHAILEKHLKDDTLPIAFIPEMQGKLDSLALRAHASFAHKSATHATHDGHIAVRGNK